jgi:exodeoxyribonuclease III
MKLISWNCQGAFRKKAAFILSAQPDIVIIQECESPEKLIFESTIPKPTDQLWFNENQAKGIGIFSYSTYRFSLLKQYNPNFKLVIPISVSGGEFDFTLYAICANHTSDKGNQYIQQVWKAIHYYDKLLDQGISILAGDFNANKIWDKKTRTDNYSDVVNFLAKKDIQSCYHHYFSEDHGLELQASFYLYRHQNKPYHLDYCFASNSLLEKMSSMVVGKYDDWHLLSDHMPLEMIFLDD